MDREVDERPRLVTAVTLGRYLSLHRATVLRWAKAGRIPCRRITKRVIRFDPGEVERWLMEKGLPPPSR